MARKKKHPEHVNHERWLVSYADFITLLFAFFVVMFAVSQVDSKKVGRFTQSFNEALEWSPMTQSGASLGADKVIPEIASTGNKGKGKGDFAGEKKGIRTGLSKRAAKVPALYGLNVLEVRGELVLRLPEKLMFDRGEAAVSQDGKSALDAIAEELKTRPVRIRVEGHTDATPIHTARFPSNWELSMARAMATVDFLLGTGKIDPPRMGAAGYAEHHPIASNETNEGRAQNRRVDLIIVADFEREGAEGAEPPSPEPKALEPAGDKRGPAAGHEHDSVEVGAPGAHAPRPSEPARVPDQHGGQETKP
jgi:chemotaxis protein MotB